MARKTIETIADLQFDIENSRRRTERSSSMLMDSLQEVGAARSIVIDEKGVILAGNGTIEAAGQVGIQKVQVIDVDGETIVAVRRKGLTKEQKKRLAYFDNRTGELADWNLEQIKADLEAGIDLKGFWREDELGEMLAELQGNLLEGESQTSEAEAGETCTCPKCGFQWRPING